MKSALVTNIQGYSIHDGPGIRTVVFLKGCTLHCKWCANPENISPKEELGFIVDLCKSCGRCAKTCQKGAVVPGDGVYRIDGEKCTRCFDCLETCYYDALVGYGQEMSPSEAFDKVRRDKMFYDQSGGGVTVSGGEPLCHPEFVGELFKLCHDSEISTAVETCGCVPWASFKRVLPFTDMFLFDLKLMDPEKHREMTGSDNAQILSNAQAVAASGTKLLFRQPVIPGINDDIENITATAEFMKSLGDNGMDIQLMPYHRMGTSKYDALNIPYQLDGLQIMSEEQINYVADMYNRLGVRCTVSK